MVREERLELSRVAPLEPKSSAYTNFATLAKLMIYNHKRVLNTKYLKETRGFFIFIAYPQELALIPPISYLRPH